jgi:Tol biopolymer transport system component
MGIVYRAEDTKLDRTVALKLLPPHALVSEDDKARFYREARSAAALNHPNIAHVYEIDEAEVSEGDLRPFIAMEYIDGETMADRIAKGPIPLKEAISYASQMAEGLKAAHRKDVVHRDVKSGNMMLTSDGTIKILDFGLAKTAASTKLTQMGSTLGTVAYMSPEQARGEEVDRRSDIWSLGVILYEMITGVLPFRGDYEQAVVYGILNEDPDSMTNLRAGVPMALDGVIAKMLAKDPDLRYQNVDELPADLKAIDVGSAITRSRISTGSRSEIAPAAMPASTMVPPVEPTTRKAVVPVWIWGLVAVALIGGAATGALMWGGSAASSAPTQFVIELEDRREPLQAVWSADSRSIYYIAADSVGGTTLVRRFSLDTGISQPVPGTDNVDELSTSPDGRWLIIRDVTENRLERLAANGGQASPIPGTEGARSIQVAPGGDVYFATSGWALMAVSEEGEVRSVASNDTIVGRFFAEPIVSPSGNAVYWGAWLNSATVERTWGTPGGAPAPILDQYRLRAITGNGLALVQPSGPVGETVSVVRFDPSDGTTSGAPRPVAFMNSLALSESGHLVFEEPADQADVSEGEPFYVVDDRGINRIGRVPGVSNDFAISPDGASLVAEARQGNSDRRDIYRLEIATQTVTRLTRDGQNNNTFWSPDGDYVYWDRSKDDVNYIVRRRSDASGSLEVIVSDSTVLTNPAITPDGRTMLYSRMGETDPDLFARDLESGEERLVGSGDGFQTDADIAPDGRYVVYRSGDAQRGSILVAPLDGTGEVEVTDAGGYPVWSQDGSYIYYSRDIVTLYRVAVTTDPVFRILGREEVVYRSPTHIHFDLLPDGGVIVSQPGVVENAESRVRVILNFEDYATALMEEGD